MPCLMEFLFVAYLFRIFLMRQLVMWTTLNELLVIRRLFKLRLDQKIDFLFRFNRHVAYSRFLGLQLLDWIDVFLLFKLEVFKINHHLVDLIFCFAFLALMGNAVHWIIFRLMLVFSKLWQVINLLIWNVLWCMRFFIHLHVARLLLFHRNIFFKICLGVRQPI